MTAFAAEAKSASPLRPPARESAPEKTAEEAPRSARTHELAAVAEGRRGSEPIEIGRVDDPLEHEADRIAARTLSDEAATEHAKTCSCGGTCSACRRAAQLRRVATGAPTASAEAAGVPTVLGRPGTALPRSERAYFEPRLGTDLSDVRVHAGVDAAQSAAAVGARAYTVGSDLVFGAGEYAPETEPGRRLIAHELAHVLQERAGAPTRLRRQPPAEEAPEQAPAVDAEPDEEPEEEERPSMGDDAESPLEDDGADAEATPAGAEAAPGAEAEPMKGGQPAPAGPAPAPDPCVPSRALTWADFQGAVPAKSPFGAATRAPIALAGPKGAQIFQARLDSKKSWVRTQFADPTNGVATGCAKFVKSCENAFAKLKANQTLERHFTGKPDKKCPASEVPAAGPKATSQGECSSVLGTECDRAAGVESARLLKHEQLHMDISCVFAKKANAAVASGSALDKVKQAVAKKASDAQKAYDKDSNHGCIAAKQGTWETDVAGGLKSITIP